MFEIILVFSAIFLAIIGLSDILHKTRRVLFKDKKYTKIQLIHINNLNAVSSIVSAVEEFRWYGREFADKIICSYSDIEENVLDKCKNICKSYNNFVFCNVNDIEKFLN